MGDQLTEETNHVIVRDHMKHLYSEFTITKITNILIVPKKQVQK